MTREECIEEWETLCWIEYQKAEEATNGNLIARDRFDEFCQREGSEFTAMFLGGPSRQACYWASEELLRHWVENPRTLWSTFATKAGVANAEELRSARNAQVNQAAAVEFAMRRLERLRRG